MCCVQAFHLVRQITDVKRDVPRGDFLDMFYELQRRLRYFSYDQLKDLFQRCNVNRYGLVIRTVFVEASFFVTSFEPSSLQNGGLEHFVCQ